LLGYDGDPRSKAGQESLWSFAEAILPKNDPGRLNQALMELGATVCTPRDPKCELCPVNQFCRSFREGTQASIPRPKTPTVFTDITEVSIAIHHGEKYLLRRRSSQERWAGLWDFVRFEIDHGIENNGVLRLQQSVLERTGLSVEIGSQIAEFKHGVTRYRITLKCLLAKRIKGRLHAGEEWHWVEPNEFSEYPLSVTARKLAELLARPSADPF
jgi:A/G-specific adenine glycosylase